jgi:hypothetical protein
VRWEKMVYFAGILFLIMGMGKETEHYTSLKALDWVELSPMHATNYPICKDCMLSP